MARRRMAIGWAFALLTAWLLSLVVVQPVAAQTEVTPSTPCFTSTNLTNLSAGGGRGITNQPVISGNGARVSFWSVNNLGGSNVDGNIEVFVRETGGNNSVVQLTDSVGSILGGFNLEPSISSAGTHIAFYSDRDLVEGQNEDGNFEIFLARRANNGSWSITQITDTTGSANLFPSINAAGNRIAFVSDDSELHNIDQTRVNAERNFEIFLATIPNSGAVQFRQVTNTGGGVTNDQPVINAAGDRIAFTAATGQTAQVLVWDQSQSAPTQLTQTDINDQPSISADGTSIVYIATTTDDRSRVVLHTLSADGSESRAEVIVPAATNTKYRSPSISGNGERVVYVAEQDTGAAVQINVLLYDINTRLGVPISEVGGGTGEQPAISSDGTRVTFVGVRAVGGSTDDAGSDIYLNECPQADLAVSFVNPPIATVLAGVDVEYQFRITNSGPSVAEDAFFSSDLDALPGLPANVNRLLPSGCSIDANNVLVCTLGDIAVNASRTFTMGYDIPSNAGLGNIVSQIEVGANVVDSNPGNNATAQFSTRIFEESALSLAVVPDRTTILAGSPDQLTYDLVVTNGGPSQARSARITDTLPSGVTFVSVQLVQGGGAGANCPTPSGNVVVCQLNNLTSGSTTIVRIKVTANANAPATLTNVATVRSLTQESNLSNNTVTTVTTVERTADLAITKVASSSTVIAGREITYTLFFTNNGFADTLNATVIDNLPQNVTYVRSTLPSGASCTPSGGGQIVTCNFPGTMLAGASRSFTLVASVGSIVPAGTITNTARVLSGRADPNAANDVTPAVQTQVTLLSDLAVSKTVNETTPDVLETITYTVKVRNAGPSQAYNVVVTDLLPFEMTFLSASASVGSYDDAAGLWTIGTLPVRPVGQESTLVIRARIENSGGGDTKTNTATAGGSQPEPAGGGLPSSASVDVVAQLADVSVVKSSVPAIATHVIAGERLTYTLRVQNSGPTLARSVQLTDVLPDDVFLVSVTPPSGRTACTSGTTITCAVGDMAFPLTLDYTVVVTRELKGLITNTVSVSSVTPDIDLGDNNASHTIQVDPGLPDHLVFTVQPPTAVTAGEIFNPIPVVEIRDKFDNLIDNTTGSTDTIRLTPYTNSLCTSLGTSPNSLINREFDAVGGVATFPGINYTKSEIIYLRASNVDRSTDTACSTSIGVNADDVETLEFTTPERTLVAGDIPHVSLTVRRLDQFGNENISGDFTIQLSENSPSTGVFVNDDDGSGTPINSAVISSNTATTTFYYTDTVAGTYVITASAPGGVTPAVQMITVTAAPAQELLVVISAPLTTTAGVSSGIFEVQRTDRFNNPNSSDPTVTVNLSTDSSSGQGGFRNAADTITVTQITIPQGQSTAQFRYRDTLAELHLLSVSDAANVLFGDDTSITVVPAATYRLVITSTPQTIVAGEISAPIQVIREDVFGNRNFNDANLQVDLTSSSPSGADEFRATELGGAVTSVTIPQGSDYVQFYYTDELADTFELTASATGIQPDSQEITVIADVPDHLAIITTTTVITAGAPPITITIQRQDQFDNPASNAGPLEIFLEKQSPQGEFLAIGSNTVITKVTISNTDASFRYQDRQQGNWILTFTDNNPGTNFDATQPMNVTAAVPTKLVYLQKPTTTTAGVRTSIFEVQRQDVYDNPYTGPDPLTVFLTSSSSGNYSFTNGIDGVTTVTSMVIAGGTSTTTFYYQDNRSGNHLITADDSGSLTAATTTLTVQSAGATKLVFINSSVTMTAGVASGLLTVQVQDEFNNPVTPTIGSPVVVDLTTNAVAPPAKFRNAGNTADITQLSIGGSSTGSFRYYDEKAGTPNITVDDDANLLTGDVETVTVRPAPASKIIFTTQPLTLTAGVTSTLITVQRLDQFNNPNFNDAARTLNLTENSPAGNFVHATNNVPVSSVTIPNGSDQISFRYHDRARGLWTLTVTPTGSPSITAITQAVRILGAAPVRLQIQGSASQTAGTAQQLTIGAYDAFNNQSDSYTGVHSLTFSGAGNAPDGTQPTVTNASGTPTVLGTGTDITFNAGLATAGGSMVLYDAAVVNISITDTVASIGTGASPLNVTVTSAAIDSIGAETSSGGAEVAVYVPSQNVTAGGTVQLFAVGRDTYGNSRGNVAGATWAITATGGVNVGNLSTTSGPSTTFTGNLSGTAVIEPRTGVVDSIPSGTLTVVPAADAYVRVETAGNGTGTLVTAQTVAAGNSIQVYAVVRDTYGNFKGNPITATWDIITPTAGVSTNNNLSPLTGASTTFTAKEVGSGGIRATVASLARRPSQLITVATGSATRFGVSVTGISPMPAGSARTLSITAYDAFSNVVTSYAGSKSLTFSGAQASRAPVTQPTVANSSSVAVNFGTATPLVFTAGVLDTGGSAGDMRLYHAPLPDPTVTFTVTDGTISGSASFDVVAATTDRLAINAPTDNLVAGTPVNLNIIAEDIYGNMTADYTGSKTLRFNGDPDPNQTGFNARVTNASGTAVDMGSTGANNTAITFATGQSTTSGNSNGQMTLYKVGTFEISVQQSNGGFQSDVYGSKTFTVTPSQTQVLTLDLASPQANRTAFANTNTVSLKDQYGNPVPARPVTITTSLPGSIIIAGSGNDAVLETELASTGTANLASGGLAMRYEGVANTTGIFTATTTNPLGGNLTATDSVLMNHATATQMRIQGRTTTDAIANTLTITAGQPISLSIGLYDQDGNLANTVSSVTRALVFSLSPNPSTAGTVTDNDGGTVITINGSNSSNTDFANGVSAVASDGDNGKLTLVKTGTYTLTATNASPALTTQSGHALVITVQPAPADSVVLALQDNQVNNSNFTGTNTVTAYDAYSNLATNFGGAGERVTITVSNQVTGVVSLGGPTALTAGNFANGVADLTAIGLKYTGLVSPSPQFRATLRKATGVTALSNDTVVMVTGADSYGVLTIPATTLVAGASTSATLKLYDLSGNPSTLTGSKVITFTGASNALDGTVPAVNQGASDMPFNAPATLNFTSGTATFNVKLYKVESATISATGAGGVTSTSDSIAVTPAVLNSLTLNAPATATAGVTFTAALTGTDIYSNPIANGNQTISFSGANASPNSSQPSTNGTTFGSTFSLNFTGGSASVQMVLRRAEVANVIATIGAVNSNSEAITVSSAAVVNALTLSGPSTATTGSSFNVTVSGTDLFGNPIANGNQTITFDGASDAPNAAQPTANATNFGTSFALSFSGGSATVAIVLPKAEAASLVATIGTVNSNNLPVAVSPGALTSFAVAIAPSQILSTALDGAVNTITALDAFQNIKTNFDASSDVVTVTRTQGTASPFTITGLGSGNNNVLNQAGDFVNGIATLTNKLIYTAGTDDIVRFTATANSGPSGQSNEITYTD